MKYQNNTDSAANLFCFISWFQKFIGFNYLPDICSL